LVQCMNRKLALATLVFLFSVIPPLDLIDSVSAQSQYSSPPSIEILSPIPSPKVYQDATVALSVAVNVKTDAPDIAYVCYSLDGNANTTITELTKTKDVSYWTTTTGVFALGNAFSAESTLNNLTDGTHTLTVYSHDAAGKEMSKSLELTVNSNYVPPNQPKPRPSVPESTVIVNASSLEVTIKNQPITAYIDANGFRFKDHEDIMDWNYAPLYYVLPSTYGTYYKASTSDYTIVSFTVGNYPLKGILASGHVDMQVIALIGRELPTNIENGTVYTFDGLTSDWSITQTITINASSNTPMPTINTGSLVELPPIPFLVVVPSIITVIIVSVLLLRHRKTANLKQ
jgi:hypothetical protein